jgi:hypothetical protein
MVAKKADTKSASTSPPKPSAGKKTVAWALINKETGNAYAITLNENAVRHWRDGGYEVKELVVKDD